MSLSTMFFSPRNVLPRQQQEAVLSCSSGPFTWQLYQMLVDAEIHHFQSIVSWQPHGRAFRVHDPEKFEKLILSSYFKSSKYKSFSRQLNLYSFVRLSRSGPDQGACKFLFRLLRMSTRRARIVYSKESRHFWLTPCLWYITDFHRHFIKGDSQLCKYMVRQKGEKPRLLPCHEPNFYADASTAQVLLPAYYEQRQQAITSPIYSSTAGQDRGISSNPIVVKKVSSALMIASSSSPVAKSSFVPTPSGAMQKMGKIPRVVSAEVASAVPIVDDSTSTTSVSTNDSKIPKMMTTHRMMVSPHPVLDGALYIPNSSSTPQQEVIRSTRNENIWVTEEDYVATNNATSRRPFSCFRDWIQDYETIGDFEGRKFFFVACCDRLENCVNIQ
jgi:hypothetical protein